MERTESEQQRRQRFADVSTGHTPRLLPWTTDGGKPCFLSADGSGGYVSRLADSMEAVQLGLAADLVQEARDILEGRQWTTGQLHLLAVELTDCLADVHRVAESRGARLPHPAWDDVDVTEDRDDEGGDVLSEPAEAAR